MSEQPEVAPEDIDTQPIEVVEQAPIRETPPPCGTCG